MDVLGLLNCLKFILTWPSAPSVVSLAPGNCCTIALAKASFCKEVGYLHANYEYWCLYKLPERFDNFNEKSFLQFIISLSLTFEGQKLSQLAQDPIPE